MISAAVRSLVQFYRKNRLHLQGVDDLSVPRLLATGIQARRGLGITGPGVITIAEQAWIEAYVILHAFGGKISIGPATFLGPHTVIYGHGGVEIGAACLIAMHCRILSSNHTIPPHGIDIRSQPDVLKRTRIGRDVWLGAGVTVLGGVTIGDGCVVGAGSVVSKDLPAGTIAMGVPARVRGHRLNCHNDRG